MMTSISSAKNGGMLDVIIVGAGAAGVGCGVVLKHLGFEQYTILERHSVGASFARWPKEMRFITPSFTSNAFGLMDLNANIVGSSPAFGARREHFDGPEYVDYLTAMADLFELPVELKVEVTRVQPLLHNAGFAVHTTQGIYHSRFVIWAAGEFQYPRLTPFPGAELCLHNSHVRSWADLSGDDFLVVGGAESGIDAAVTLSNLGKEVTVLDSQSTWENESSDPSCSEKSKKRKKRLNFLQQTGTKKPGHMAGLSQQDQPVLSRRLFSLCALAAVQELRQERDLLVLRFRNISQHLLDISYHLLDISHYLMDIF